MKKYKLKAPSERFEGVRNGVKFRNGEAEAELSEVVANQFKVWGYEVTEEKKPVKKQTPTKKTQAKKTEK